MVDSLKDYHGKVRHDLIQYVVENPITMDGLAQKIGIARGTINDFLYNKRTVTFGAISKIVKFLEENNANLN